MYLYAATIFTSSFLLFLIQPILAKQILPWFGGSAAVWTTCLVFFQFVLLFGYTYADWTTRKLAPKHQATLHVALLLASLALLPVLPDPGWKPLGSEDPGLRILGLLTATIGLPYFLLSTTGPLVQAWFARTFAQGTPYRLFALSNLASMLALIAYPIAVEPWISSLAQGRVWSLAYALFVALCAAAAWRGARAAPVNETRSDAASPPLKKGGEGGFAGIGAERNSSPAPLFQRGEEIPPASTQRLAWFVFAATGSFLLLAITNYVCMNIAAIPFLWVAPLSLYLLSFILCFDGKGWYRRGLFMFFAGAMLIAMAGLMTSSKLTLDLKVLVPVYLAGLFICCMFCHGELAATKPAPRYLTSFYLMISLGGAMGALLVGVIAPYALPGYYELGGGLLVVALLLLIRLRNDALPYKIAGLIVLGSVAYACYYQIDRYATETRVMKRNFYGSLRTWDTEIGDEPVRKFVHGAILHGQQFLAPERRREPTTYYSGASGVGRILSVLDKPGRRVGVIGLGAGTLAAYGRSGDYFRIYEITPLVIGIAETEFSYLKDSGARVETVLGDARLNLEREAGQKLDLLVIDAFSGDAIPVHLITREAVAVYRRHLVPGGVLAFHVTNRYLDLAPVVKQIADGHGLASVLVSDNPMGEDAEAYSRTDWVLVSADRELLQRDEIQHAAAPIASHPDWRLWTDDFNNLFQILK